jgi:type II secretory pathway pseudopilin PulG
MKKLLVSLSAIIMLGLATAPVVNATSAKEAQAQDLRTQALKAQLQADSLNAQALKLETEIVEAEAQAQVKPGEKMRGYGAHQCVMDCLRSSRGASLFSCRRACGAY